MFYTLRYFTTIIFSVFFVMSVFTQAQRMNTDSMYLQAKENLLKGNYEKTRNLSYQVLHVYPDNYDFRTLVARSFLWEKNYNAAQLELDTILKAKPDYKDALYIQSDLFYWTNNCADCIKQAKEALIRYPEDSLFVSRVKLCDKSAIDNPNILMGDKKNKVSVYYVYDYYVNTTFPSHHLAYTEYARNLDIGTLIGRLSYANSYHINGVQGEVEGYIKLHKKGYSYLNAGYSEQKIFPHYRFGAEYFHSFSMAMEASLGMRYLNFDSIHVVVYTASIGKYLGNWYGNVRIYLSDKNTNSSVSYTGLIEVRKYFSIKENYCGLKLNYGYSPDDRNQVMNTSYYLKSLGVRAEYNRRFFTNWIFNIAAMYQNEEWETSSYRNIYTIQLGISYLF